MLRFYKYLFYRLYLWNLRKWGEGDYPQYNAMFGVSFMMFLKIIIIIFFLKTIGINTVDRDIPFIYIIIAATPFVIINYFQYVYKGKYKQIALSYKNESKDRRFKNLVFLWLYVVFSFAALILFAFLSNPVHGRVH